MVDILRVLALYMLENVFYVGMNVISLGTLKKIPTGNSYCLEKSQAFVDNYGNGEYKPLLFHSPDILSNEVGFLVVYED